MYRKFGKRAFDFCLALLLLGFLWPLLVLVSLAIVMGMGGPVLFRQERPGLGGRSFGLFKFRTMGDRASEAIHSPHDSARITRIGRVLRRTSLDEIPGLFNVLKGEMSFVGPRPLLVKYLPLYTQEQSRRHDVRPGITGWAQVNGRNALNWESKFDFDLWYVRHYDFRTDMKILILTIARVFQRTGIDYPGDGTAVEFDGGKDRPASDLRAGSPKPGPRGEAE